MPLDKRRRPSSEAVRLAKGLLGGSARYTQEGNLAADLAFLLAEIGIDPLEIEREHPSGRGRIDLYIPRYRTIFEMKAKGKAADPDEKQPGREESPRQQLERYMQAEISAECERPPLAGTPSSYEDWTGIVTDGRHWHVYSYPHVRDPTKWRKAMHSGPVPGGAKGLLDSLCEWVGGAPVGRRWIPSDPSPLFAGKADELAGLFKRIPESIRRRTETKRALWHDMLRVSGMSPKGQAAPDRLFVTHSLLIAIARMVTHVTARRADSWKLALRDGLASWLLEWPRGRAWTEELWAIVSRYDWRRRRGDVLRSLYEEFVPEADRKVFGEFYTPDWLAAMMVEQVLDKDWLQDAIERAEDAILNRTELKGRGVLDPSCGSGTFLYHAALRMLKAPAMQGLQPTQKADVAALLLNGIDVHPVAVEIAKANLMRVLPAEPSAGESALRVHLGDSLLAAEDRGSLFGHVEGSMRLVTPEEREILIPVEFVKQDGFADSMRRLVDAAGSGDPLPRAVLNQIPKERREELKRSRDELEAAIGEEGNSVWTWYAVNIAAPHLLSERKVDRIVANPPWVQLAHIQEPGRKRAMEGLGARLGLQAGGKQSPHLDIATFFVLRTRELYLNAPGSDPAAWLVKRSALRAGHWELFRKKHKSTLGQSVDLEQIQPFGGGDARKCCLLLEHLRLAERTTETSRLEAHQSAPAEAPANVPHLEARLRPQPGSRRGHSESPRSGELWPGAGGQGGRRTDGHPKKPRSGELWPVVRGRLEFAAVPDPLPQAPSGYGPEDFRQGATIVPHVLLLVERTAPAFGRVRVRTQKSKHRPWSDLLPQEVELPKQWLSKLYRSVGMLPFVASSVATRAIIPVDEQGDLDLDSSLEEPGWETLDAIYQELRGKGKNTPRTLARQIDFAGKLSSQPRDRTSDRRMVLYPKSGDIMRAARTLTGDGFVSDTMYWHVTETKREAGYLVSILNAPCLRRAFAESKESGRDFHLHPWRKVPIPRFDGRNRWHVRLAELCERAEEAAEVAVLEAKRQFANAGQAKLSNAVRERLKFDGIFRSIDMAAARLLPSQAEWDSDGAP